MSLITATVGRIAAPEPRTMPVPCGRLGVRLGVVRATSVTGRSHRCSMGSPATTPTCRR
jgi:hypothetical protein